MDTSLFFAKLFGIYSLVMAVVWLVRGPALEENLKAWLGSAGAMMLAGVMSLFIGAAVVASHQVHELSWRGVITLFGYIAVLKGALLVGWPHVMARKTEWWMRGGMRWISLIASLALGLWLCWIGFSGGP